MTKYRYLISLFDYEILMSSKNLYSSGRVTLPFHYEIIVQKKSLDSLYMCGVLRPRFFCRTRSFENTTSHSKNMLCNHLETVARLSDVASNPFLPWKTRVLFIIAICPGLRRLLTILLWISFENWWYAS